MKTAPRGEVVQVMTKPKATLASDGTDVVAVSLAPVVAGDVTALAALRLGDELARVYFNHTTKAEPFGPSAQQGDPHSGLQRIVQIGGQAGMFIDAEATAQDDAVQLQHGAASLTVALKPPALDLLAGHDCLLCTVNEALSMPATTEDAAANPMADPDYIRGWLAHHVQHQGVTAALILNRLGPDGFGADFADELQTTLAQSPLAGLVRVVIVDVPVPTGRTGAPDERHLLFAPDAPGKNRMDTPAPDPWRAPFADEVLFDYLHHAYFQQAQGVSYLDLSDWLTPPLNGEGTVFEMARNAKPDALLGLTGLRAFPWKIPNQAEAVPGDHICRPFDLDAQFSRWVVSPAMTAGKPQLWRPHRIIGLKGQLAMQARLWRFMGLRHPGAAPAQLAPKSSLREDAELLEFSQKVLGHDPFRVPEPETTTSATGHAASQRGDKIVLVTAMKNEGPFLLEWIAYHKAIGVSDIVVFTNDCTDGTDTLLDTLAARGIVEHYPNPYREMDLRPQHAGFRAAEDLKTVKTADWLMTLDVDEFINIHVGDGHLRDLFARIGDANMISCTWRLFGNGGLQNFRDEFVTRQFTQCAAENAGRPHQAWGFKTLYQNNGYFKKLGVHRPKGLRGATVDQVKWVNGSGQPMPEKEYRNGWRSNAQTVGYDLVTLNHYAVRTTESFLVKRDRGRVNHVDRDQGSAYWFRMNHNTTTDTSIQRIMPTLDAHYAAFMADPAIKAAHDNCVARHQAKIAELLEIPEHRDFYALLGSARYESLSKMLPAFGSNVFLAGPQSVPQELVNAFNAGDLPADYYFTVERPDDAQH